MIKLAEKLARLTPGRLSQTYFTSSGTEADETGVMMAQLATGNSEIVALRHGVFELRLDECDDRVT
mgnify:CR=1 FL=1